MDVGKITKSFSAEVQERVVWVAADHKSEYGSKWAAIC